MLFTDRVSGQWSDEGDQEGAKYRELNYTLSISSQGVSASFGPKTAETTEKQVSELLSSITWVS